MSEEQRVSSFDALAKGLASGTVSRGKALRLMGAALVGGTLASVPGIASAAPKPRPNGRKCKTNSQCASGNCAGGECQGGCPTGQTACPPPFEGQCYTPCTNGQVFNPDFCACEAAPTGITVECVCGGGPVGCVNEETGEHFDECFANICPPGQTCPTQDEQNTLCTAVCGEQTGFLRASCTEGDFCSE